MKNLKRGDGRITKGMRSKMITYIRRDPYLSPIASNFWTGSKASAVGL